MASKKKVFVFAALALVIVVVVVGLFFFGMEAYTSTAKFCGTTCHIMLKPYKSWKADTKHFEKDVACIKCHYAPGEKRTQKAQFASLAQLFSYLAEPDVQEVRKRAHVKDASCKVDDCHPPAKYLEKKIRYTNLPNDSKYMKGVDKAVLAKTPVEYKSLDEIKAASGIPFIHKTHEEKTVEGQKMHCNTCHQHTAAEIHFEVPKETCFLCHFKNTKDNEGRAKCSLCHAIPDKNLRKEKGPAPAADSKEEKKEPITHKSLEKNKVTCQSCHFVVEGSGEVKMLTCFDCHDVKEKLDLVKKSHNEITKDDKKKMHEKHIAEQNANCFQCHGPLNHGKVADYAKAITEDCSLCHGDTHAYQRMLLAGDVVKGKPAVPGLMNPVNTNCMGCHLKVRHDEASGNEVAKGNEEGCVNCHTKRHKDMLQEWKDKLKDELKDILELEKEAKTALSQAKGKVPKEKLAKAEAMFDQGQKYLNIVRYGNGVHNKKYSVVLIDAAYGNFADMIDMVKK